MWVCGGGNSELTEFSLCETVVLREVSEVISEVSEACEFSYLALAFFFVCGRVHVALKRVLAGVSGDGD